VIKNFIFKLLALVFPALLLLVMLEGVTYILFKSGKIQLIEAKSLAYLTKVSPEISNPNELVYVPHPYFGYVYYPNDALISQASNLKQIPMGSWIANSRLAKKRAFVFMGLQADLGP